MPGLRNNVMAVLEAAIQGYGSPRWMAGSSPLLSGLFYITETRPNLDVTPESALALIRGLGEYSESSIGPDPG